MFYQLLQNLKEKEANEKLLVRCLSLVKVLLEETSILFQNHIYFQQWRHLVLQQVQEINNNLDAPESVYRLSEGLLEEEGLANI